MPLSGIAVSMGRNTFDPLAPAVPYYDIHNRTSVLHDSGNSTSGIVSYISEHLNKYHARVIPNSGFLDMPITTAVYFYLYHAPGGDAIDGNIFSPVSIDMTIGNISDPEYFALSTNTKNIIFWYPGTYLVNMRASTNTTDGSRATVRHWLEKQPAAGGGYSEVGGTRIYTYVRSTIAGEDTGSCTVILEDIDPGDRIRIRSAQDTTGLSVLGVQTAPDGYGLMIERME